MIARLRTWLARPRVRMLVTIVVIVIGLAVAAVYGIRSVQSFRQLRYIQQQGLDRGTASVDAIRPWMTVRFVAVAYAVPEEYLFNALDVPYNQRNTNSTLRDIEKIYQIDSSLTDSRSEAVERLKKGITEYRANPVTTGLHDVRLWMSIRYIANSSGVPESFIFQQLGIPQEGNDTKPLGLLSDEQHYPGGPRAFEQAVQRALDAHQGQ
ncbi:hypothetical protein SE17_11895 [Kouleothrix aurantiaca]|jgi:hypothetical protein|uniref:Uncharacterized protein n=1 Tax=Kouleothrix aurantiaca TaxID=186479 RepID=A0A0P9DBA6_9CHLR|nr:hypothetical protein SE17_11895 [Kouleothrix aurantiaca]